MRHSASDRVSRAEQASRDRRGGFGGGARGRGIRGVAHAQREGLRAVFSLENGCEKRKKELNYMVWPSGRTAQTSEHFLQI
jgi:hypothetical protein